MTVADRQGDERFADWVDGRMGERERERFVAELRVNAQLRADLAAYERTVAAVRAALQAPTRPVAMADRVRAALVAAPAAPAPTATDTPTLRLLPRVLWSLGTAAAALLAALWLDAWSGGDRAPTAEQTQVVARRDRAEPTGGLRGSDVAAGRGEAGAEAAADGAPAADPAAANPAAAAAPSALAVGNAALAPQGIAQTAETDARAATAPPRPGEPVPGAAAASKDPSAAPGSQAASDDVALGAARPVGGGGGTASDAAPPPAGVPADAKPAARAAAKAAPAPVPTPLLALDVAAPPAGDSESAEAERKPAPAGGGPLDAAGLRAALRAFLVAAVAEAGAATASWPTAAGVLQLSPWLDDPAIAADGNVRSWLVEGDKADVAALIAVAAEFARDRAGAVQNGEVPVALPAATPAENRVAPSARLVLRLKLRRR